MVKERENSVGLRDKVIVNILCEREKVTDDCKVCECVLNKPNTVRDYKKERKDVGSYILLKNERKNLKSLNVNYTQ